MKELRQQGQKAPIDYQGIGQDGPYPNPEKNAEALGKQLNWYLLVTVLKKTTTPIFGQNSHIEKIYIKVSMNSTHQNQKNGKETGWISIFAWLLLALVLRWQVIEPRWIPSGSMLPTLQIQDRILIEKIRPRVKHLQHGHLNAGSVVVFYPPQQLIDAGYEENSALIKRLVGVPGDKIEVKSGKLIRNGEELTESWLGVPMNYEMDEVTIPNDYLWVLGDNRNNSLDSHLWGFLPEGNVIGTAIWRYWPINQFGPIRFPTHQKVKTRDHTALRS